jgi:hypothetical protein
MLLKSGMKLQQGQIWKKGEEYFRIVEWARLSIKYKVMTDPISAAGTMHQLSKKEFCRLIKNAELLSEEP